MVVTLTWQDVLNVGEKGPIVIENKGHCNRCKGLGRIYDHDEMYEKACSRCDGLGNFLIVDSAKGCVPRTQYNIALHRLNELYKETQNLTLEIQRLKEELEKTK